MRWDKVHRSCAVEIHMSQLLSPEAKKNVTEWRIEMKQDKEIKEYRNKMLDLYTPSAYTDMSLMDNNAPIIAIYVCSVG